MWSRRGLPARSARETRRGRGARMGWASRASELDVHAFHRHLGGRPWMAGCSGASSRSGQCPAISATIHEVLSLTHQQIWALEGRLLAPCAFHDDRCGPGGISSWWPRLRPTQPFSDVVTAAVDGIDPDSHQSIGPGIAEALERWRPAGLRTVALAMAPAPASTARRRVCDEVEAVESRDRVGDARRAEHLLQAHVELLERDPTGRVVPAQSDGKAVPVGVAGTQPGRTGYLRRHARASRRCRRRRSR